MDIALIIILNIIPLYILIALGFISGKWLEVNLPSMATIAIYILAPAVNFGAMTRLEFKPEFIPLFGLVFIGSATIGFSSYMVARRVLKSNEANLIGMGSVTGNTGYFGLPIVLALFGPDWAGLYLFINLGAFLNEIGLGYYLGARGHADVKGALLKVIKLPVIHAVWLGLLANMMDFALPDIALKYWNYAVGAWVIIGMMLIGVALSKQPKLELDPKLMLWMFTPKFILWPLFGAGLIALDTLFLHNWDATVYQLLVIFCCVPLAGNLVAYASTLHLHPERTAGAVLVSTLLGIVIIPSALALYSVLM